MALHLPAQAPVLPAQAAVLPAHAPVLPAQLDVLCPAQAARASIGVVAATSPPSETAAPRVSMEALNFIADILFQWGGAGPSECRYEAVRVQARQGYRGLEYFFIAPEFAVMKACDVFGSS